MTDDERNEYDGPVRGFLAAFALLAAVIVIAVIIVLATRAVAAEPVVGADYQMNETSGPVLVDSSGHVNGTIGTHVRTLGGVHTFFYPVPDYDPQRIDLVSRFETLVPGVRNTRVLVQFRTGYTGDGKLVSFGQSPNDMIRIQISRGAVYCDWHGTATGTHLSRAMLVGPFNDLRWHTLVCTKTALGVGIGMDGSKLKVTYVKTGGVYPKTGLAIGGKGYCNGATVDCDYYQGYIGRVWVGFP